MFSKRLKALLLEQKKQQIELATFVKVRPSTVSDWLNKGTSPKIEHLYLISEFFNTSLDWLIKGTDKPYTSQNKIDTINDTSLSAVESNIIKIYRNLDKECQQEFIDNVYELKAKSKNNSKEESSILPNGKEKTTNKYA